MHLEHRSRKIRCAKISTSDSWEKTRPAGNISGFDGCNEYLANTPRIKAVKSLLIERQYGEGDSWRHRFASQENQRTPYASGRNVTAKRHFLIRGTKRLFSGMKGDNRRNSHNRISGISKNKNIVIEPLNINRLRYV